MSRGVEMHLALGDFICELVQRGEVIQNPKRPTVGRSHQILVFDH